MDKTVFANTRNDGLLFTVFAFLLFLFFQLGGPSWAKDVASNSFHGIVAVLPAIAFVFLLKFVNRSSSITLTGETLVVRSLMRTKNVPVSSISRVNVFPEQTRGSIRIDFKDQWWSLKVDPDWYGFEDFISALHNVIPNAFKEDWVDQLLTPQKNA